VAAVPAAVPGGTSVKHNRSWVDFCRRDNQTLVPIASARDNGVAQDNKSVMAVALQILFVQVLRFELMGGYPALMQD